MMSLRVREEKVTRAFEVYVHASIQNIYFILYEYFQI